MYHTICFICRLSGYLKKMVFLFKLYYIRFFLLKPDLAPVFGFGPKKTMFKTGFDDFPVLHALDVTLLSRCIIRVRRMQQ